MNLPLVSIIMPSFNSECHIKQSIESVLNQTYINWELIIIDDGSKDNTSLIVETYLKSNKQIKLIKNFRRKGPAGARNSGIITSKGKYITFLDSDDLWSPTKLELQVNFHLENSDVKISHAKYKAFSPTGEKKFLGLGSFIDLFYKRSGKLIPTLLYKNRIGILTVMMDCNVIGRVGLFNEELFGVEDHEYWFRIAILNYRFGFINKQVAFYRLNPDGISKSLGKYRRNFKKKMEIFTNLYRPINKYLDLMYANYYRFFATQFAEKNELVLSNLYFFRALKLYGFSIQSGFVLIYLLRNFIKSILIK